MYDEKKIVAAFDLDGTCTYVDTLIPFIIFSKGFFPTLKGLFILRKTCWAYLRKKISNQKIKEALMTFFFRGESIKELEKHGAAFAKIILPKMCRRKCIERLRWHLSKGHRCVLVSATFQFYFENWAKKMGFQDIICSQLEVTSDGKLTGVLEGKNCFGSEKSRRLQELLGPRDQYILYAYGDSRGDIELLQIADYPYYRTFKLASDKEEPLNQCNMSQ